MSVETAVHVHGRFQPFHLEHRAYVEWAVDDADPDEVLVGITNADPSHVRPEDADPDRDAPVNNPFAYHERHRMVTAALDDRFDADVRVLPFPINRPGLWDEYAPRDVVHYVNVLEPWHEVKAERLQDAGRTVVTKRGERTVSGTDIRRRMAAGDEWRHLVPDAVATYIDRVDGEQRVRRLFETAEEREG